MMSKKRIGVTSVNFSYKQKQDDFRQYKYCYCITKVQNGLYNLGYNKTSPKTIANKYRNQCPRSTCISRTITS